MSIKSIIKFIFTNVLLFGLSALHFMILTQYNFLIRMISFILRNFLLVKFMDYILNIYRKKNNINEYAVPVESYKYEFKLNLLRTSILEFIAYEVINILFPFALFNWVEILYFIIVSFLYELIFDFFHYWTHRLAHSIAFIYKKSHKLHHKNIALIPIITFVQEPFDLILTNMFPIAMTLTILNMLKIKFSLFIYVCIMTYKSYVEIAGHAPIIKTKSCAFPQCIWLPKMLGIELYSKNHNKHHAYPNTNFSKRFSLWDKVFGTWID